MAEEQHIITGFVTCCVMSHPVMPGLSGEIEELYVQPALGARRQEIKSNLVRQAVAFMQAQGVRGMVKAVRCKSLPNFYVVQYICRFVHFRDDASRYRGMVKAALLFLLLPGFAAYGSKTWQQQKRLRTAAGSEDS